LRFLDNSRYPNINVEHQNQSFLIGLLGEDVEIYFYHEKDEAEAKYNWEKRLEKIQWDNLYISYCCDRITAKEKYFKHLAEFEQLDLPYKVAFTPTEYPQFSSAVYLPNYIDDSYEIFKISAKTFNILAWIDKKYGKDTSAYIIKK
jgi:uncharacterized protein (DUF1919 family)